MLTIILVCAAATAPADCSRHTALYAVHQAPAAGTMCGGIDALADLAASGIRLEPGRTYPKVVCSR